MTKTTTSPVVLPARTASGEYLGLQRAIDVAALIALHPPASAVGRLIGALAASLQHDSEVIQLATFHHWCVSLPVRGRAPRGRPFIRTFRTRARAATAGLENVEYSSFSEVVRGSLTVRMRLRGALLRELKRRVRLLGDVELDLRYRRDVDGALATLEVMTS